MTAIWPVRLSAAFGNMAEDTLLTSLWCVFQAQGILQEYLLAMTTDEQLLNHTAMVRLKLLFCFCIIITDDFWHLCLFKLKAFAVSAALSGHLWCSHLWITSLLLWIQSLAFCQALSGQFWCFQSGGFWLTRVIVARRSCPCTLKHCDIMNRSFLNTQSCWLNSLQPLWVSPGLESLLLVNQRAVDTQQIPQHPPSPCFEYVWATLRTNVFGNYCPLAFVGARHSTVCVLCTVDLVTHQRSLKAVKRSRGCGVVEKKNIVGGSVEQLPNTCRLENKSIGDLAVVITIMITMMQSSRVNWRRFTFKGLEKCSKAPLVRDYIFSKSLSLLWPVIFWWIYYTTTQVGQCSEDHVHSTPPWL